MTACTVQENEGSHYMLLLTWLPGTKGMFTAIICRWRGDQYTRAYILDRACNVFVLNLI